MNKAFWDRKGQKIEREGRKRNGLERGKYEHGKSGLDKLAVVKDTAFLLPGFVDQHRSIIFLTLCVPL